MFSSQSELGCGGDGEWEDLFMDVVFCSFLHFSFAVFLWFVLGGGWVVCCLWDYQGLGLLVICFFFFCDNLWFVMLL